MFSSLAIVCLILGVFIVDDIAVEARSCKTGGLQCSSEQGNSVDFCSWDPHAWITQDNVICTACDDILLGGSQGIRCDAVALYNQFDGNALWLKAPMSTEVKDKKAVLTGGVRYEPSKKMRLNYLIGQPFGVNEDKDSHRTFHRVLLPTGDKAYASVRVQSCFQLVINGNDANGEPIHFAAQGPTDLINIEEKMLWLGKADIASIEIAAVPHCKIRSQGVVHEQQGSPAVDHVDHSREHRHIPERNFNHEDTPPEVDDEASIDERSLGRGLGNRHFGMEDRMHGFLGGRSILHGSDPFGRGRDWESSFVRGHGGRSDASSTSGAERQAHQQHPKAGPEQASHSRGRNNLPKRLAVDKRINKRVLKIGNNRQPKRRSLDDTPDVRQNHETRANPKERHDKSMKNHNRRVHREEEPRRDDNGASFDDEDRHHTRQNRHQNSENRRPNDRQTYDGSVDDDEFHTSEDIRHGEHPRKKGLEQHVDEYDGNTRDDFNLDQRQQGTSDDVDYGDTSRNSRSRDHSRHRASVDDDYDATPQFSQSRDRRRYPKDSANHAREHRDPRAPKRRRETNRGGKRATPWRQEMPEISYDDKWSEIDSMEDGPSEWSQA